MLHPLAVNFEHGQIRGVPLRGMEILRIPIVNDQVETTDVIALVDDCDIIIRYFLILMRTVYSREVLFSFVAVNVVGKQRFDSTVDLKPRFLQEPKNRFSSEFFELVTICLRDTNHTQTTNTLAKMTPAIDPSALALTEESITIQNMNCLESPSTKSTLESPIKKKARVEKGAVLRRRHCYCSINFFASKLIVFLPSFPIFTPQSR